MADNIEEIGENDCIDEIVLICDSTNKNDNDKENEESEFLKKLSLSGFQNENFNVDIDIQNSVDSMKHINLNDENLPKENITSKKEHNGIPFIRTGRSANRPSNYNKENLLTSKVQDNNKSSKIVDALQSKAGKSSIPRLPNIPKSNIQSLNRPNISQNANSTPIFRVPLAVKPNATCNARVPQMIPKMISRTATLQRPKPATMPRSPKLSTSIRALERNKFNFHLKEKESEMKLQKIKEEEVHVKETAKKMETLRKNLVHKPEPIRKYNP